MVDLVEAGGMRGTPENIAEFLRLTDADPAEVKTTPVDRLGFRHGGDPRPKRKKTRPAAGTRQNRNTKPTKAAAETADESRIAEFERKVVPWGKFKGQRWGAVPLHFVQWFAGLADPQAPGAKALQVAVREYLELKYGLTPGRLF